MSDTERLIEVVALDNGLQLELYDASVRVAGDRWTVKLVARIEVATDVVEIDPDGLAAADLLGATVLYEQMRERVFVDDADKGRVFGELRASFLTAQLRYVGRPDFGARLVRKRCHEELARRRRPR